MSDDVGPVELLRDIRVLFNELWSAPEQPRAERACEQLADQAQRGYPRGGRGGGRARGSHADPVLRTVLDERARAEAARLLSERDEIIDGLKGALMKLQAVEKRVAQTLEPNAPINYKPGCLNCSTVAGDDGRPHFESYQEVKARGVCGWCYRFQFGDGEGRPGYGVKPTAAILRWHLDHLGTEVPKSMMKDQMPDAHRAREMRKTDPGGCFQPTFINGVAGICARTFMHEGQCLPADELAKMPQAS